FRPGMEISTARRSGLFFSSSRSASWVLEVVEEQRSADWLSINCCSPSLSMVWSSTMAIFFLAVLSVVLIIWENSPDCRRLAGPGRWRWCQVCHPSGNGYALSHQLHQPKNEESLFPPRHSGSLEGCRAARHSPPRYARGQRCSRGGRQRG